MAPMKSCTIFLLLLVAVTQAGAKDTDCSELATNTRQADVIVIATVKAAEASPGFWSGVLTAQQTVTYRKDRVLKGNFGLREFTVEHTLVSGTRTADAHKPQLDERMFHHGRNVILFLHVRTIAMPDGKRRVLVDVLGSDCAVIPATQRHVLKVLQVLNPTGT